MMDGLPEESVLSKTSAFASAPEKEPDITVLPLTSSVLVGEVVPIPTLPEPEMYINVVILFLNLKLPISPSR